MFTERLEAVRMNSVLPAVLLLANVHGNSPARRVIPDAGISRWLSWLTRLGLLSANNH